MLLKENIASIQGWWRPGAAGPGTSSADIRRALERLEEPFCIVKTATGQGVGLGGQMTLGDTGANEENNAHPILAYAPPCLPESLGDASFLADHSIRYPYAAGAMANGIGSAEIVEAMSRAGMIGFFGAAGLSPARVEAAIDRLQKNLGTEEGHAPYGFNLIHSPGEPDLEAAVVDLYLRRGIRLVDAAAYLRLTLPLIRYRVKGIHRDADGRIVTPNRVIAKVSRIEVATRFFSPPPAAMLRKLVEAGEITEDQAKLAEQIPVAQDLTAEADSGGHTDNQPFVTLLPTMLALRDELQKKYGYTQRLRVGAAGGIGTPAAAAAAFAIGASYILTGSINQSCVESGTSDLVRQMLCKAEQADVAMAPAADMFEMGVRVQVLKRGTMFAMRAAKLYELYKSCGSLEEIPEPAKATLEKDLFRAPVDEIWRQTHAFFAERDPRQNERAEKEPKHKMALVFRWYLGQSSNWAKTGDPSRQVDYQVWCGPAMGSFNEWVKGSFLEEPANRTVVSVARNLLAGAAFLTRVHHLRSQGVVLPPEITGFVPLTPEQLKEKLN